MGCGFWLGVVLGSVAMLVAIVAWIIRLNREYGV